MGLFNMMDSKGKFNELLPEAERELRLILDAIRSKDVKMVELHVEMLASIASKLLATMSKSSEERSASYNFAGKRMTGEQILYFLYSVVTEIDSALKS